MVSAQIRDDCGGLGNDCYVARHRLQPAAMIRQLGWAEPRRLPGDSYLDRVLEHRGRGRKQSVRQISIVVVHGLPHPGVASYASLAGASPVECALPEVAAGITN